MTTLEQLRRAKDASAAIAAAREADKNRALTEMAASLELHTAEILARNQEDVAQAQGHISPVMLDRLRLTEQRIQDMAQGVRALIDLPDPVGRVLDERTLENGLLLRRISVPLGVGTVAGCYVQDGKLQRKDCQVRLVRDGIVIHEGVLASLQRFKDSVKEVVSGYECGLSIEKFNDIKEGDIIEAFTMEEIPQ